MHIFDIIASILALILIILGIKRGFVEEIIRLVGIVLSFFISMAFYRQLATHITFIKLAPSVITIISFIAILLASLVIIFLFGLLIKKIIHLTVLGWVDRLCGGVLGFLKAFFLIWIATIIIISLPIAPVRTWAKPAISYTFFSAISPQLKTHGLLPESGPVQNILRANPVPSLIQAYKKIEPAVNNPSEKATDAKKKVTGQNKK
jgi:membrane protein required for colicin V production